jgi:hypothetical protein
MNPEYTHAVRIEVEDRIGTGVLYFPPKSSQFYVVTARHVIYGDQEPQETVIQPICLQNISPPFLAKDRHNLPSTTRAITAPDKEHDLTILLVDTSILEVSASLSNPEAVSSDYGLNACSFTGFPDFAEGEIRKITCFFEGYPRTTPDRFLVRSNFDLSDTDNKSEDNVRGASGSGLYFHYESRSYLAGIITDYTKIDSFYGTGVTTINKLLLSKGLAPIATVEFVVDPDLKAVNQNNKAIQARIKSTVGTIQVPRVALKNNIQVFQNNRVFLVHGNAGAGKSAFARDLVAHFRPEYEVFAFSGEQFSRDTLELVFQNLPTPITRSVDTVLTNPNFRPKKLFWIESAEKLIETGRIDALIELLARVKDNSNFKVLITLRTYMLEILQLYINLHLPQDTAVVPIANFSDEELELVVAAYPDLRTLLTKNKISNLLHVPFYLNYAVRLLHLLNKETDLTESKFRQIIWQEVIEKGNKARGDTFEALAVKRAKDMSLYTQVDAASDIIASLHGDHLIVLENDELKDRYCPAHDILEDWALMRYILRNRRSASSPEAFFRSVGNELPIRRAFRLWLGEALQVPDSDTIDFINKTLSETAIAPHWKDELYISILRSDFSYNFIGENAVLILGNNRYLDYKFINIL